MKIKQSKKTKIERPKLERDYQESKKDSSRIKYNSCQYQYPNCLKIATAQHILKLGVVAIEKSWICDNCYKQLQAERQKN